MSEKGFNEIGASVNLNSRAIFCFDASELVDDITDTHSDKTREAMGQGAANVITGFFGGMGGCAMIGQTMINVKVSGARTRISTFLAGVFLLILVVGFGDVEELVDGERAARGDITKPARAGADFAENHDRQRAVVPALPDVGTAGRLANGM